MSMQFSPTLELEMRHVPNSGCRLIFGWTGARVPLADAPEPSGPSAMDEYRRAPQRGNATA